jgi:hypothetical protein
MKKILAIILASLSVSAQSIDLSNLVNKSQSIVDTFDAGIQRVSGMEVLANQGYIAPVGTVDDVKLTYEQAQAYNNALQMTTEAVYTMTVEEFVGGQVDEARSELNSAVNAFVGASEVLIHAVKVNDMAEQAQESGDAVEAQAVQSYIADNNVEITDVHVDVYNESLDTVEQSAQTFAAFVAVQNDEGLVQDMQAEVDMMGEDFLNAYDAVFDASTGIATLSFHTTDSVLIYGMIDAYTTTANILASGQEGDFYTSGPTANDCFFDYCEEQYAH